MRQLPYWESLDETTLFHGPSTIAVKKAVCFLSRSLTDLLTHPFTQPLIIHFYMTIKMCTFQRIECEACGSLIEIRKPIDCGGGCNEHTTGVLWAATLAQGKCPECSLPTPPDSDTYAQGFAMSSFKYSRCNLIQTVHPFLVNNLGIPPQTFTLLQQE